jgi:hypothetical protein
VRQDSKPAGPGSDRFGNPSDIIGGAAALSVSRFDMLIGTLMAWAVQLLALSSSTSCYGNRIQSRMVL